VLIPTVLLASIASLAGGAPTLGGVVRVVPMWASYLLAVQAPWRVLQLAPPCARLKGKLPLSCLASLSGPNIDEALPAVTEVIPDLQLPSVGDELNSTLGGFLNFDVMHVQHLRAGPQISWLTPESPREDLLRLRVLASGWGIRYTWDEAAISVGLVACTRFVKMGEVDMPVIDMLTSEARVEFILP
jgi:hypothetical protein